MTLLTGKALEWATAVWDLDCMTVWQRIKQPYNYFTQLIRDVFQYPAGGMLLSTNSATSRHQTCFCLCYPVSPLLQFLSIQTQDLLLS